MIARGGERQSGAELLGAEVEVEESRPKHVPVLGEAILSEVEKHFGVPEGLCVDATVGAGGHSSLLLERFPGVQVLGLDQDPSALELARERLEPYGERVQLERARFTDLLTVWRRLHAPRPILVLADLGASSMQLDQGPRGFSFQVDGPLDMRMDPSRDRTAVDIVNGWDESDLADLFFYEGGERHARRIARALVEERRRAPFRRTLALAGLVERVLPGGRTSRIHPATKVFQALRRAVNEEGEELLALLAAAEVLLADRGLLAVVSFHSGEDGEVKRSLRQGAQSGLWRLLTKKPVCPTREEERANPRARSAHLRVAERTRCPHEAIGGSTLPTLESGPHAGDEAGGEA